MPEFTMPKTLDECRTLSYDDTVEHHQRSEGVKTLVDSVELARWTIESAYGPEVFEVVRKDNRKVNDLYALITRASFGLSEEVKNLLRSGSGATTRTDSNTAKTAEG